MDQHPTYLATSAYEAERPVAYRQYVDEEHAEFKVSDYICPAGALTAGASLWPGVMINTGGAVVGSVIKGENQNSSMAGAALGTLVGYGIGSEAEGALNGRLNPWYRSEWVGLGFGISRYSSPSNLPWFTGAGLGAFGSESTNAAVNILLKNWSQREK